MSLDPSPKPVCFQDVAVGERIYRHPDATAWDEKIPEEANTRVKSGKVNVIGQEGVRAYIYPLETVWRK